MGQKTHPIGFRLNVKKSWNSTWFADKNNFADSLEEDVKIRKYIAYRLPNAGISNVEINRTSKKVSVTIPKGVDDGTRIRLAGKGEAGTRGGASGDLYLFINVKSHELFKRSDVNLFFEFPISIADAALGTTIEIPTIDGKKAKIKIPDGTQDGKQFRLKGKGMPFMRRGDFGDLYVQIKTEVPVYLNKEQRSLLEKFREIENDKSNPSIKKFFQKAKDFWKS